MPRGGRRKGAGRPRTRDPGLVRVEVLATPEEAAEWARRAAEAGRPRDGWLADVVREALGRK